VYKDRLKGSELFELYCCTQLSVDKTYLEFFKAGQQDLPRLEHEDPKENS